MPGPLEVLRRHHQDILKEMDVLEAAAEGIDAARPEASSNALRRAVAFLRDDLRPHAAGEEHSLYPAIEPIVKEHGRALAPMEMAHLYLEDATARFAIDVGRLLDSDLPPVQRQALAARIRRTAQALKAVLTLHLREEDELLLPLAEKHLSKEQQEDIVRLIHETRRAPDAGA